MRAYVKLLTVPALCLLIVLSSVSVSMARGVPYAVTQIVICTGHGTAVITLDAKGNRTAPPHECPECISVFATNGPAAFARYVGRVSDTRAFSLRDTETHDRASPVAYLSRAPPQQV